MMQGSIRPELEMHGVTFIDGSGLRVLAGAQRRAVASSGGVRLVATSPCVRPLLVLAGAGEKFRVFDTVHQALSKPLDRAGHAS
jgi:anti-anti-sigma factor